MLLYHVVPGQLLAEDVLALSRAETLLGQTVEFSQTDDGAFVNDAELLFTDLVVGNGVIHVVDAVLEPRLD